MTRVRPLVRVLVIALVVALDLVLVLGCSRREERRPESANPPGAAQDVVLPEVRGPRRYPDVVPELRLRFDPAAHLVEARIEVDAPEPLPIHLLFRVEWEGYPELGNRLRKLEAWGSDGALTVTSGEQGPGHRVVQVDRAERVTIAYSLELAPPSDATLYHRVSQLAAEGGHLIGNDALPRLWLGPPRAGPQRALLWFTGLPPSWRVATVERHAGTGYELDDIMRAVFIVGPLRSQRSVVGPHSLTTAVHGRWPVDDDHVFRVASAISGSLHRLAGDGWAAGDYLLGAGRVPAGIGGRSTGGQVVGRAGIVYVGGSGPAEVEFGHWRHTTAHELMHWYIPTAFRFEGEVPRWFSEGFTEYMALKVQLVGGLIAPQEFLDGIGERLARYRASPLNGRRSVPEAEKTFWEEESYRYIYDGGAAAAFLLDLGFQDRGRSLERALAEARRAGPLSADKLQAALAAIPENDWIRDWLAAGRDPDWDARLRQYRLAWSNGTLRSLDDWATRVLSTIRP
jgi:predicted metalloprotease with PDZ domain